MVKVPFEFSFWVCSTAGMAFSEGSEALGLKHSVLYSFRKETLETAPQCLGSGKGDKDSPGC